MNTRPLRWPSDGVLPPPFGVQRLVAHEDSVPGGVMHPAEPADSSRAAATMTHEYKRNGLLLIKTVGVGQSATVCCRHDRQRSCCWCWPVPASTSNKKGMLEVADVNNADGPHEIEGAPRGRRAIWRDAPHRSTGGRLGRSGGHVFPAWRSSGSWDTGLSPAQAQTPGGGVCNGEGLSHHRAGAACRTPHGNASPMAASEALHGLGEAPSVRMSNVRTRCVR